MVLDEEPVELVAVVPPMVVAALALTTPPLEPDAVVVPVVPEPVLIVAAPIVVAEIELAADDELSAPEFEALAPELLWELFDVTALMLDVVVEEVEAVDPRAVFPIDDEDDEEVREVDEPLDPVAGAVEEVEARPPVEGPFAAELNEPLEAETAPVVDGELEQPTAASNRSEATASHRLGCIPPPLRSDLLAVERQDAMRIPT